MDLTENATRQVLIAGSAAVYHQIALGEQKPAVLLFTMVGKDVSFLQLTAAPTTSDHPCERWKLSWTIIANMSLDCTRFEGCFTMAAFSHVIRTNHASYNTHFNGLWGAAANAIKTQWWVEPRGHSRSSPSPSTSSQAPGEQGLEVTPSSTTGHEATRESITQSNPTLSGHNVRNRKRPRHVLLALRVIGQKLRSITVLFTSGSKRSEISPRPTMEMQMN
jgi:hypothetical protein